MGHFEKVRVGNFVKVGHFTSDSATLIKICRDVSCTSLLMLQQQVMVPCVTFELLTEKAA